MSSRKQRPGLRLIAALACLAALGGVEPALPAGRFVEQARPSHGPAEWLSLHGDRIAFGDGRSAVVATVGPTLRVQDSFALPRDVAGAVLVEDRLYTLADDGIRVARLDLDEPGDALAARLRSVSPTKLSRMDDYLIVAEDRRGIRLFEMPHHGHAHGVATETLQASGELRIDEAFTAVGSSFRRIYLATASGRLLLLDARDPSRPLLAGEIDLGDRVHAVAGRGTEVFALQRDTLLEVRFAGDGSAVVTGRQALPGGRALVSAGRTLHVATGADGLITLRDATEGSVIVPVTVGDNFFQPASVSIDVGDTVRWEKNTIGLHNVESCDGVGTDPTFCGGQVSPDGSWSSGGPTSAAFTFAHTFSNPGTHPYFCVVHTALSMNGVVTAADAAPAPPTVPDGSAGTPLLVDKADPAGAILTVQWDDATCADVPDHHIVFGSGQSLPATLGGTYGVAGSQCDVGSLSPTQWSSPDTALDPGGLIWFLVVADDDGTVEGSWGEDGDGLERSGPGAGGASGECGMTAKDLTNACGR